MSTYSGHTYGIFRLWGPSDQQCEGFTSEATYFRCGGVQWERADKIQSNQIKAILGIFHEVSGFEE